MKVQEAEKTPGMFFVIGNDTKIHQIFFHIDNAKAYIKEKNKKVQELKKKIKGDK